MIKQQLWHDDSFSGPLWNCIRNNKHGQQMETALVLRLSAYSGNLIPSAACSVSIFCPPFTLISPSCLLLHIHPLSLLCTPATLSFPLSSIHPTQCYGTPADPIIEISAREVKAQREMLFRGNFSGAEPVSSSPASWAASGIRLQTAQR